ncbi:hypothetical protein JCM17844_14540 [Iodidimonas gelatinilytica]|nr:hypothetical protein JCM17844_14540 [Iodidimonas gelatinilytica]
MHMPGLVLHDPGGAFSEQTEAVLRDARNIDLSRAGWSRLMHPQR